MKRLKDEQLVIIMQCVESVVKPMFSQISDRLEAIEERQGQGQSRMKLEKAAELYDVNLCTLRIWCLRGEIPGAVKRGKRWYVTPEGMNQVFEVEKRRKRGRWPSK